MRVFAQTPEQIDTLSASVIIADDDTQCLIPCFLISNESICFPLFGSKGKQIAIGSGTHFTL